MANLKPINFSVENDAGDSVNFKSKVTVSNDGNFCVEIPNFLLDLVSVVSGDEVRKFLHIDSRVRFTIARKKVYNYISSDDLTVCRAVIRMAIDEHLSVETTEELIITYSHELDMAYVVDNSDGGIYANGYDYEDKTDTDFQRSKTADWSDSDKANNSWDDNPYYSLGICAEVILKKTHAGKKSTKIEYCDPDFPNLSAKTYGEKLNSFIGDTLRDKADHFPQMPYTEENAKFFYDMMIGLCALGHRFSAFFSDQDAIKKAIAGNTNPLLEHRHEN